MLARRRTYALAIVTVLVGLMGASLQPGGAESFQLWRYLFFAGLIALALRAALDLVRFIGAVAR